VSAREELRRQLLEDLDRLHNPILRGAGGDRSVKLQRDQLEGAVEIKMILWGRSV